MVPPPMPGSSQVDAFLRADAADAPPILPAPAAPGAAVPGDAEDALGALPALFRADLEASNRLIVDRMQSPVALIPQLAAHIVAAGGKRLRPLLTLAAARLCGYPSSPVGHRHVA